MGRDDDTSALYRHLERADAQMALRDGEVDEARLEVGAVERRYLYVRQRRRGARVSEWRRSDDQILAPVVAHQHDLAVLDRCALCEDDEPQLPRNLLARRVAGVPDVLG
eukprot:7383342-Prymnesium_polylepis.1